MKLIGEYMIDPLDEELEIELDEDPVTLIVAPLKKVNYLNNKDMLREIHKSKNSYCEYIDPKYCDYDAIVDDVNLIFLVETQEKAQAARAARFAADALENAMILYLENGGDKPKLSEFKIKSDTIPIDDLVFRVLTYDHIPLAPGRKKNPKNTADKHLKLNFPPFKHYIIENGAAKEVGKSHYKNGKFNIDRGSITNKLAKMFILMVNKYGQRSNWRGYCVDQETEALTKRGWLNIDQISEADTILSYTEGNLKWSSISSIYRGEFDGLMHKITNRSGSLDSLVTPNHKIVTERGLVPVELLLESDKVVLMGAAENNVDKVYSDDFVELMGWIVTEGHYEIIEDQLKSIRIYQNPGPKADRIRQCLTKLNYTFSEGIKSKTGKKDNICFHIFRKFSLEIQNIFPTKNLTMDFIVSLTASQRELLINTMIDGDGWRTGKNGQHLRYVQKDKKHIDLFQALCAISGKRSNARLGKHISFGKEVSYYTMNIFSNRKNQTNGECLDLNGGKRSGRSFIGRGKHTHPNEPTTHYKGMVWCPETEYGCFVARRNNTIYLTGNTYLDEMKGQALLQLAHMGLQFDESKSDNPFSYYTQSLQNSFIRVLNLEKKNQDLRDDLLIDSGASPSFSRQLAIEEEIRHLREDAQESVRDAHE